MCIFKMARRLAAIAALTALVSSCGGSSGGDDDEDTPRYTVTATAGAGGSVDPASVAVDAGQTTQITATPDANYLLDDITGTCSGLRNGNLYTTGPINADCTANFLFVLATPQTPATLSLGGEQQQFVFTWSDVADADFYRLLENPDGASGYSQIGGDIAGGVQTYSHPVTLYRRINASYILQSCNSAGCSDDAALFATDDLVSPIVYVKASNTGDLDRFGNGVALADDGNTLVVGAPSEDSDAQSIDGDDGNDLAPDSGAAYVFVRSAGAWVQQAYLKASDAAAGDGFGNAVSLSADGNLLAVGASVAGTGGAVYLFTRSGDTWSELQRLDHPNPDALDLFGSSVSLSGNGERLAIGVPSDDSDGAGINPANNDDGNATGAVYIFQAGTPWVPLDYIKSASPGNEDAFGGAVSLDHDGNTLAVGASGEDSANFDEGNDGLTDSGAVYVFQRGAEWEQKTFLKASNRAASNRFGNMLDLDAAGDTLVVGALQESSVANLSGAAYVFQQAPPGPPTGFWLQYGTDFVFKAGNAGAGDRFGTSVAISADGNTLAIGAYGEDSSDIGVAADENDDNGLDSGAVYLFAFDSSAWAPLAYVKGRHRDPGAQFGTAVALSADGETLAAGAFNENGTTTGIDGTPDLGGDRAGAVFVY